MKKLLDAEQHDLLADLRALPRNSTVRKVNELVKRARMAKVHAHILNHLRNQFGMFGKKKTQGKLLDNLGDQFKLIQRETNLPAGDFPNPQRFKTTIEKYDIHKFPKVRAPWHWPLALLSPLSSPPRVASPAPSTAVHLTDRGLGACPSVLLARAEGTITLLCTRCVIALRTAHSEESAAHRSSSSMVSLPVCCARCSQTIKNMDDVLGYDIPNLMKQLPAVEAEQKRIAAEGRSNGKFGGPSEGEVNPFTVGEDDLPVGTSWAISRPQKQRFDNEFNSLDLSADNKVSGANAKRVLLKTKLEPKLLKIVWDLSDIDKDGALDSDEFAVAMYIIDQYQSGVWTEFPATLPDDVVPPRYRKRAG